MTTFCPCETARTGPNGGERVPLSATMRVWTWRRLREIVLLGVVAVQRSSLCASGAMGEFEYDFGYGETYPYSLFNVGDLTSARPDPGLYAWFLRTPLDRSGEALCDPYRKVFAEKKFEVEASAPLGEMLVGRLARHQPILPPPRPGHVLDEPFFAKAFAIFAPPVYIGRSKSIRTRLLQHVRALQAALEKLPETEPGGDFVADTDRESAHFGARMGALLARRGIRDSRGLFVKVVYAPDNAATKRAELILNRTFHPTLGRL